MIDQSDPIELSRQDLGRHDRITRDFLNLSGRVEQIVARNKVVTEEVAVAKGRKKLKPEIDEILEDFQNRIHERSVGSFQRMLTAISDDVLPRAEGQRTIQLELGTERGLPALDVQSVNAGEAEEITSGAVQNVIGTGLRFIALARSGARQFMLLDEADCFIREGEAVSNYFSVVNQLSRDAGIQVLMITHHDPSEFAEDFRIYRMSEVASEGKHRAQRMDLVAPGIMEKSELQEDYISFLQVENVEAYRQAQIELSPGVTIITGENEGGKSGWSRILRAAFLTGGNERLIRHGHDTAQFAVGFSDGRVYEYQRTRKGATKAEFALHSDESWDARLSGVTLKAMRSPENLVRPLHHTVGGKQPPTWVAPTTGIYKIDDINVQLYPQTTDSFMMSASPSERASLLSIGRESGFLYATVELHKAECAADNEAIASGEKELAANLMMLNTLQGVAGQLEKLDDLKAEAEDINAEATKLRALSALHAQLVAARNEVAVAHRQADALSRLGGMPDLLATEPLSLWIRGYEQATADSRLQLTLPVPAVPEVETTSTLEAVLQAGNDYRVAKQAVATLQALPAVPEAEPTEALATLAAKLAQARTDASLRCFAAPELPDVVATQELSATLVRVQQANADAQAASLKAAPPAPEVDDTARLQQLLDALTTARLETESSKKQQAQIEANMRKLKVELEAAKEALGDECPICHSILTLDMLIGSHGHEHAPMAHHDVRPPSTVAQKAPVVAGPELDRAFVRRQALHDPLSGRRYTSSDAAADHPKAPPSPNSPNASTVDSDDQVRRRAAAAAAVMTESASAQASKGFAFRRRT